MNAPLDGAVLKWDGERSEVRTDNERPSSCRVGGGSGGGGVTFRGGCGEVDRDGTADATGAFPRSSVVVSPRETADCEWP